MNNDVLFVFGFNYCCALTEILSFVNSQKHLSELCALTLPFKLLQVY